MQVDAVLETKGSKVKASIPDASPFPEPTGTPIFVRVGCKFVDSCETLLEAVKELFLEYCMYKMDGLRDVVAAILW